MSPFLPSEPQWADLTPDRATALATALSRWEAGQLRPADWNRRYLPHYFGQFPPADFHHHFDTDLAALHSTRAVRRSYIAPRGGAKSTWNTLAYPLRAALEGWEPYTLILSDSSDQADQHLGHIRREIEENDLIRAVYDSAGTGFMWRGNRIVLKNGAIIEALGTGKKIRGRRNRSARPSLIVLDDIQSHADVISPTLRERAWSWVTREVIPAGDERTNFLAVGSAIHRDAVSVRIGQLAGWAARTFRAVHSWPERMDLWQEFERQAGNLADDNRGDTAMRFYHERRAEMDRGAVTYWPERWPLVDLMLLRATVGADAFESEYQGVPGSLEGVEWPAAMFQRPDLWFDDWPSDIVAKVQSLDPSRGASDASDYQAHVLLALSRFGTLFVDCELRREPAWVERALELASAFRPNVLVAESNNTMGLLVPELQRLLRERQVQGRGFDLRWVERIHTAPKLVRIRAISPYLSRKNIRFRNTPGGRLLVDQLRDVPHGDHDDGPDALATAILQLQEMV